MKQREGTVMLGALLAVQWFGSAGAGMIPAAGHAAYLAVLAAGVGLTGLCAVLPRVLPQKGLMEICESHRKLRLFLPIAAALPALLSATAMRDGLSLLNLTLLPQTPRWFALAILLPAVIVMSKSGTVAILRTVRLLVPVSVGLYVLVMLLTGWGQFDVWRLFPLLGPGTAGIHRAAGHALTAGVWLVMLLFARSPAQESRGAWRACLVAAVLTAAGYLCCALLPGSGAAGAAFPLHRLSLSSGLSLAFGRMQALFVFAWLPMQAAAAAMGLALAAKALRGILGKASDTALLFLPAAGIAALALPDPEQSPLWLNYLMQSNVQCLLLLPLLVLLYIGRLREKRDRTEGQNHA